MKSCNYNKVGWALPTSPMELHPTVTLARAGASDGKGMILCKVSPKLAETFSPLLG